MSKKISEILQQKLQQSKETIEKPAPTTSQKQTATKTATTTKRKSKIDLLEKRLSKFEIEIENKLQQLQSKLQHDEKTDILFKITDSSEYDAVKFAIAKCMNLFKASKYDSHSSPMKSFKEKWEEITIRQKWDGKEDKKL